MSFTKVPHNITTVPLPITTDGWVLFRDGTGGFWTMQLGSSGLQYQPLNANLTSISNITMTEYGLGMLSLAGPASARQYLGIPSSLGTVTSFTCTTQDGIISTVLNATTTPKLLLSLGDITPISVTTSGNITDGGNLIFTGSAKRIIGDFTNATRASRILFQTSSVNTNSLVGVIPSGTGTISGWNAYNSSDPDNAGVLQFVSSPTLARLNSTKTGAGTTNPIGLQIDDVTKARLQTNGDLLLSDNASYLTWQGGLTDRGYYVQHDSANSGYYAARVGAGLGFGATAFTGTVAGGSWAAKTGTPANAGTVFRLEGWDTTAWFQSNGYLAITAAETWSASGHGTRIALYQTRTGDTTGKEVLVFDSTTTLAPNIRTTSPASTTASITIAVPNDTGLASTKTSYGVYFQNATRAWVDGTVASQSEYFFAAPTYNKTTTAATFTQASTVSISGPPVAGTGVTISNPYSLWVQSGYTRLEDNLYAATEILIGTLSAATAARLVAGGTITATAGGASAIELNANVRAHADGDTLYGIYFNGLSFKKNGHANCNAYAIDIPSILADPGGFDRAYGIHIGPISGATYDNIGLYVESKSVLTDLVVNASISVYVRLCDSGGPLTLSAQDMTLCFNDASPFSFALTAASANYGRKVAFKNIGAGSVTVDATGMGQLFTSSLVNTLALATGDSMTVISNGTCWMVFGYSSASSFSQAQALALVSTGF